MIPPAELRQAIQCLVADQVCLRREETPPMVAKVVGFKVASAKLKDLVAENLASMIEKDGLVLRDEKLFLP